MPAWLKKLALSTAVVAAFVGYVLHSTFGRDDDTVHFPTTASTTNHNPDHDVPTNSQDNTNTLPAARYKNGQYTGDVVDALYGNIQVGITISGGRISDVLFLQYPNDRQNSVFINQQALPILRQEVIQSQSARVDGVSGATQSSEAFVRSVQSALSQAS